jgi:hypothetical protein
MLSNWANIEKSLQFCLSIAPFPVQRRGAKRIFPPIRGQTRSLIGFGSNLFRCEVKVKIKYGHQVFFIQTFRIFQSGISYNLL